MFWSIIQFIIICFIGTTGFYVYDSIAVMGPYLLKLGFSEVQISLLYSVYYYPNVIFSILAGILVDKWGTHKSLLLFSLLSMLSCGVLSISINFYILLLGRMLLGIAAEAIFICQVKLFTLYYSNNASLTFTSSLVYSRASSFLSYITLPLIIDKMTLNWGFYTCFILGILCFLVNILYYYMVNKISVDEEKLMKEEVNIIGGMKYCLRLPSFWIMLIWAFCYYGAFMSFTAIAPIIIQKYIIISAEKTNQITSFLTFGAMIGSPIVGFITDKLGYHTLAISFGILCGIIPFSCLIVLSRINQTTMIILMLFLGFSYGIVPSLLYRSINFIIPSKLTGIATGLIESSNAIAVCILPTIFSYLYQYGYNDMAIILLVILLTITFVLNVIFGLIKSSSMNDII